MQADKREAAYFHEEARNRAKAAKKKYEDPLRQKHLASDAVLTQDSLSG